MPKLKREPAVELVKQMVSLDDGRGIYDSASHLKVALLLRDPKSVKIINRWLTMASQSEDQFDVVLEYTADGDSRRVVVPASDNINLTVGEDGITVGNRTMSVRLTNGTISGIYITIGDEMNYGEISVIGTLHTFLLGG